MRNFRNSASCVWDEYSASAWGVLFSEMVFFIYIHILINNIHILQLLKVYY